MAAPDNSGMRKPVNGIAAEGEHSRGRERDETVNVGGSWNKRLPSESVPAAYDTVFCRGIKSIVPKNEVPSDTRKVSAR